MLKRIRKKRGLVIFLAGITLLASGCVPEGNFNTQTPELESEDLPTVTAVQPTEDMSPTPSGEELVTQVPDSTPSPTPESGTENEPVVTPTVRVGLQSTDPNTVNLAAGEIQLVEFFAYW
jgi:hypothetical protein